MSERPYDPAFDARIPYYDRTPENRATRACLVKFVDAVGTHLICARRACRRGGRCADRDARALPFCWEHHRGMLRFLLMVVARRLGADRPGLAEPEGAAMPEPFRGEPLLAHWASRGVPVEALARSAEDGPDDWAWEAMPDMREHFRRLTEGA